MRTILLIMFVGYGGLAYGADMVRAATASPGNRLGVGVGFAGITGISMYADTNSRNFVQAAVGFAPYGSYAVTGDLAFGYPNALAAVSDLTPYWGVGAVFLHDEKDYWNRYSKVEETSSSYAGARIPLGVNYVIPRTPVQLAAELVPSVLLTPSTYSYVQGGVNVRVLF